MRRKTDESRGQVAVEDGRESGQARAALGRAPEARRSEQGPARPGRRARDRRERVELLRGEHEQDRARGDGEDVRAPHREPRGDLPGDRELFPRRQRYVVGEDHEDGHRERARSRRPRRRPDAEPEPEQSERDTRERQRELLVDLDPIDGVPRLFPGVPELGKAHGPGVAPRAGRFRAEDIVRIERESELCGALDAVAPGVPEPGVVHLDLLELEEGDPLLGRRDDPPPVGEEDRRVGAPGGIGEEDAAPAVPVGFGFADEQHPAVEELVVEDPRPDLAPEPRIQEFGGELDEAAVRLGDDLEQEGGGEAEPERRGDGDRNEEAPRRGAAGAQRDQLLRVREPVQRQQDPEEQRARHRDREEARQQVRQREPHGARARALGHEELDVPDQLVQQQREHEDPDADAEPRRDEPQEVAIEKAQAERQDSRIGGVGRPHPARSGPDRQGPVGPVGRHPGFGPPPVSWGSGGLSPQHVVVSPETRTMAPVDGPGPRPDRAVTW